MKVEFTAASRWRVAHLTARATLQPTSILINVFFSKSSWWRSPMEWMKLIQADKCFFLQLHVPGLDTLHWRSDLEACQSSDTSAWKAWAVLLLQTDLCCLSSASSARAHNEARNVYAAVGRQRISSVEPFHGGEFPGRSAKGAGMNPHSMCLLFYTHCFNSCKDRDIDPDAEMLWDLLIPHISYLLKWGGHRFLLYI